MIQITLGKSNRFNQRVYVIIFAFVFLLYGNSIKNNYALDDNYVTVTTPENPNNPRIEKGIKGIPALFITHYIESGSQSFEYRPLVLVTFAIEYQFFGSNPHISHFISVLLYAITCVLLFNILCKLFKNYNVVFPLLTTLLFIVHPIHTEVVDNIKCRDELLAFLFGMCSLYFILKNIDTNKQWFIFLGLLFLIMGLLCKRTAILFMALVPLTVYFFTSVKLKRILILGLILGITYFIYDSCKSRLIYSLPMHRDFVFYENPLYFEHGFIARIPIAICTMGYYLKSFVFPYPLSCYYGYNTIPLAGWGSPFFILSFIFHITIAIYALIKLPQKSILSFAILIYLGGVLPFANLVKPAVGIIGERFIYFASLGFCMAGAYLLIKLCKIDLKGNPKFNIPNSTASVKLILVIIFIFYSFLTVSRNTQWKDLLTLFRNDAQQHESSYLLQYFTANTLYDQLVKAPTGYKRDAMMQEAQMRYKKAAELLETGLTIYNTDYFSMTTLGTIYNNKLNNVDAALPWFKKSLSINSDYDITRYNIILCYEKKNQPDSAILLYEKMISGNTKYPGVYFNLHELYIKKQDYLKAIACDEKAIIQCPREFETKAYINLGNAFMLNKDTSNAKKQFETVLGLESTNTALKAKLSDFLKALGQK